MLEIIESLLNQLLTSKLSSDLRIPLAELIRLLKEYDYPLCELVDVISISIMLDYLLSSEELIKAHEKFIKKAFNTMADILSDKLYVKIEPDIISLEDDFYRNIAPDPKRFDDKLTEELKELIKDKLYK